MDESVNMPLNMHLAATERPQYKCFHVQTIIEGHDPTFFYMNIERRCKSNHLHIPASKYLDVSLNIRRE
jgi:hypothetical protein